MPQDRFSDELRPLEGVSARYTSDGQLIRPGSWRKWVSRDTRLTRHDMNHWKAAFPEFHNAYIDPESFASIEQDGEFPNGTHIVKERTLVGSNTGSNTGSNAAVSGNGGFMGESSGMEFAIEDTVLIQKRTGRLRPHSEVPVIWTYLGETHCALRDCQSGLV